MARIPDHALEALKASVSLQRLVEARGVVLKRHGADLHGYCPFHDDKTPSLVVSPAKNLWHCLGACATGGTVIDWVMRAEGVSFRHAVELLRNDASSLVAAPAVAGHAVKTSTVRKLAAPVSTDATDVELLLQVVDYYHATLKQSPEALAYLDKRGIGSGAAIDAFKLGFANRTLGLRLPAMNRKAGAEVRTRLQRLGVLRESGHEHLNGSLIVPIFAADGSVANLYGRKLNDNLRAGTPLHLYLPRPHAGVWNRAALQSSELILCESLIDALTLWVAGYRNVTTSYGTNGFTDEHLAAFKQSGTQRLLIAYDRDAAGDGAADALAVRLMAEGIDCYRVQFPKGMDANAYALNVQPAAQSLGLVIRKAQWLGNGKPPQRDVLAPVPVIETSPLAASSLAAAIAVETQSAAKEKAAANIDGVLSVPSIVEPLPASPLPVLHEIPMQVSEKEVHLQLGDRRYRVRGLPKNLALDALKVNVLVAQGERFHVDTLDLYQARARQSFIAVAAKELGLADDVLRSDLGRVVLQLERIVEQQLQQALTPAPALPALSAEDEAAGLALLRDPDLCSRIVADVAALGVVGEDDNALLGYIAAVSRKLEKPLAVLIQSTSAAGKSTLMDAVLSLLPEHERVQYSAMTGQSLFYLGEGDLRHKVLAIAEEEGVRQAAYALKLLQSQGELTMASTGKDPETGKLVTTEYRVQGPVMLMLTTTAIDIDEELLNRCLVLTINESREQTQAIHARQRQAKTLQGLVASKTGEAIRATHQAAQTLLKPLAVVNPFAEALTFRNESPRLRRDHAKYLTLIDAIALLHQHQRSVKTVQAGSASIDYIEVQASDIALANRLAAVVLGRSLDELPPQTRRVLEQVVAFVQARMQAQACTREAVRFTRRELREALTCGDTQLKLHLARLVEHEYLLLHVQGQRHRYELVFDGDLASAATQAMGLIDVATMPNRSGQSDDRSGAGRALVGGQSGTGRSIESAENSLKTATSSLVAAVDPESAHHRLESVPRRSHNGSNGHAAHAVR